MKGYILELNLFRVNSVGNYLHRKEDMLKKTSEPVHEKTNTLGSDQVRHKPGCTVTEDG